ncbi:mannitol-1-phosphate 5-dehydrogenase [Acididesulfobacillus acetoxydans]|uniref:Altronate oxidoreductase n=1 Tax=Acididesulfobacillus acetoxydans TaxID=1561005 RepID=A0A8S0VYP0_9FIRM|nr:tagaturonate reductase [Acididesulfobacillus acetoxydans]CAA7603243.1 mannitol-1-phosphate 5-dehydrogenase [Acididesulfobacillus acetoxydans]CEJ06042.1 Altronate oxidoreductase [Acididesulfobacillus acetoxydans]
MTQRLTRALLEGGFPFPEGLKVPEYPANLPERVIQFGEGNFLRAFVDWMFDAMDRKGLFNGKVVVVQPLNEGMVERLNQQDGLYTLLLRGIRDGQPVSDETVIGSISRGIDIFADWQEYLKCAENPDIEYVVSNTTEAGIAYNPADRPTDCPPASFPGKLAVYLYHRFQHFQGDSAKGMVIIPCELIDRNGDNLKKIVLRLAEEWKLPAEFSTWLKEHNTFVNTLVDRVVPGYPRDEVAALTERLGYEDQMLDTGELFHLWVVEGPQELRKRLPFAQAGLNVVWTDDMTPYRTLKVRFLNGSHTSCVPVAFLYGLDTVKEIVEHPVLGPYLEQIIAEEIMPSTGIEQKTQKEYAASVLERFRNPYIKHYLLSILLNSISKFKTRVLPSLLGYKEKTGRIPLKISFSLASLLALYRGKVEGTSMKCVRGESQFEMRDDPEVLKFLESVWSECDLSQESVLKLVRTVLAKVEFWGQDLTEVSGFAEAVAADLHAIVNQGVEKAIQRTMLK